MNFEQQILFAINTLARLKIAELADKGVDKATLEKAVESSTSFKALIDFIFKNK